MRNDIINAFESKIFFKKLDIDNITKDFSGQTDTTDTTDKKKIDMLESENEKPKEMIPEWVEIRNYTFNKLNDEINNAVEKELGPIIGDKKTSYVHLQDFLQSILNGEFNGIEKARNYCKDNIYEKYERKIRELNTKAAKDMIDVYNEVRRIFIKPNASVDEKSESDMPELESEESAEQQGLRLKILTPKQIIIRLPILLAQLKAGNNSEKT